MKSAGHWWQLWKARAKTPTHETRGLEGLLGTMLDMPSGLAYCRLETVGGKATDFEFLLVNKAFETLTGLVAVEGRMVSQVLPGFSDTDGEFLELFGRVSTGVSQRRELFSTTLQKWLSLSAYRPQPGHFVLMFDVVDESPKAESRLAAQYAQLTEILENAPSALYKRDVQGHGYQYLSPVFQRISGYPTGEFARLSLDVVISLIHPADRDAVRRVIDDALQSQPGRELVVDYRLTTASGNLLWVRDRFTVLVEKGTGTRFFIGNLTDVSDTKQLEENRAQSNTHSLRLEKNRSLVVMASSMAHLLNNHLQAVLSNLEMLELDEQFADDVHLGQARVSLGRASDLGKLMLLSLGHAPGQRTVEDLSTLAESSLELWFQQHPGDEWVFDFPRPGPQVKASSVQLSLVVEHLMRNAREAQAGRPGVVRLGVSLTKGSTVKTVRRFPLEWKPASIPYACLAVTDQGLGMDDASIDRMFDPFYSTKAIGRGLGLSVVLGIVQAHDGGLTVQSSPGFGTEVRVYLPAVEADPIKAPTPPYQPPIEPLRETLGKGLVLFVDDEPELREVTAELIAVIGYQVLTASGGEEALRLFRNNRDSISCVITDLSMPEMDGWELVALLRELDRRLPILLATGFDQAQVHSRAQEHQPSGFLSKPFSLSALKEQLTKVLGPIKGSDGR